MGAGLGAGLGTLLGLVGGQLHAHAQQQYEQRKQKADFIFGLISQHPDALQIPEIAKAATGLGVLDKGLVEPLGQMGAAGKALLKKYPMGGGGQQMQPQQAPQQQGPATSIVNTQTNQAVPPMGAKQGDAGFRRQALAAMQAKGITDPAQQKQILASMGLPEGFAADGGESAPDDPAAGIKKKSDALNDRMVKVEQDLSNLQSEPTFDPVAYPYLGTRVKAMEQERDSLARQIERMDKEAERIREHASSESRMERFHKDNLLATTTNAAATAGLRTEMSGMRKDAEKRAEDSAARAASTETEMSATRGQNLIDKFNKQYELDHPRPYAILKTRNAEWEKTRDTARKEHLQSLGLDPETGKAAESGSVTSKSGKKMHKDPKSPSGWSFD